MLLSDLLFITNMIITGNYNEKLVFISHCFINDGS